VFYKNKDNNFPHAVENFMACSLEFCV